MTRLLLLIPVAVMAIGMCLIALIPTPVLASFGYGVLVLGLFFAVAFATVVVWFSRVMGA